MTNSPTKFSVTLLIAMALVASIASTAPARAETLSATIADTRTNLALSVDQAAAQEWLPAPWTVAPLPKGPFKGANLLVFFIDRLLHLDAEGKPTSGGTYRMAVLVVPGKNPDTGEVVPFITRVYRAHEDPGPYKNGVKATVRREITQRGADMEPGTGSDFWEIGNAAGGALTFRMDYQRAVPKRVKRDSKLYSAVDPSFYRIYRYEQVIDVVKSVPANIDRVSSHELRVSIPELTKMFDGSEELVGIARIPWYGRQTFLP